MDKFQRLDYPEPWDLLGQFTYAKALESAKCQDRYIRLYVRTKPKWLSDSLYMWLLNKLLMIKSSDKETN